MVGYRKTNGVTLTINVTYAIDLHLERGNAERHPAELHFRQYHWFDQLT